MTTTTKTTIHRAKAPLPWLAAPLFLACAAAPQDELPFPDPPMGGSVGPTMQESVHKWREAPSHLPEDAPNILIVMLDDAGFGQAGVAMRAERTPGDVQLALEDEELDAPAGGRVGPSCAGGQSLEGAPGTTRTPGR